MKPHSAPERAPVPRPLAGAVGGLLATAAMTAVMEALYRALPESQRYPLPPREITEAVFSAVPRNAREDEQLKLIALAAHAGYGAAAGALYACTARRPSPAAGAAYGVFVWAASYLGWIPAVGLLKPATQHPSRRNALMIAAHVVWGGVLGGCVRAWRARGPEVEGRHDD